MPIDRIKIRSFKSIVSQDVDLGALNVFIGTNGSGKSNFLEAVGLVSSAIEGEVDYTHLSERGVRLSTPAVFKASFRNIKRKQTFELSASMGALEYAVNISAASGGGFEYWSEKLSNEVGHTGRSHRGQNLTFKSDGPIDADRLEATKGMLPIVELLNKLSDREKSDLRDTAQYAIYSLSTPILRGVSPDSSHKEPLGLYGGSLATALSEIIYDHHANHEETEILRFFQLLNWFESIGTTEDISPELQSSHLHTTSRVLRYADRYMKRSFNNLYAYDVSEGALYVLFVLVLLLHKKSPNIFALDNVDNALNPGLVRSLMTHVNEVLEARPQKQMFITTHNPTTLDAIDLFNPRHRLFVVERNDDGHTEINRIKAPEGYTREKWVERHGGMRLSEIWLSGLIGGLPREDF